MLIDRIYTVSVKTLFFAVTSVFVSLCGFIFFKALSFPGSAGVLSGLMPAVAGTAALVLVSVSVAAPLGIATAVYLHIYAGRRFRQIAGFSFDLLASVPSIVTGLFGFTVLMVMHRLFPSARASLLLASLSLSLLVLPYIVKAAKQGLEETPKQYLILAASLGADSSAVLWRVMLPCASSHIRKGVYLAIARSAEDTAVIMLTGAVASYGMPESLLSPFEALPFFIYCSASNVSGDAGLHSVYAASAILMTLSSFFMLFSSGIGRAALWRSQW